MEYTINKITEELFKLEDKKYKEFQSKLIPNLTAELFIGVRTPQLRSLAKKIHKEAEPNEIDAFLSSLPHQYFDQDQLHAFIISLEKNQEKCISRVQAFLPFVNNWATCDQLSPSVFKKNPQALLPHIEKWIASNQTYTVRFGIKMLMQYFLTYLFDPKYPEMVAALSTPDYYINMMRAWYFATALALQYQAVLPFITEKKLDVWTHNKTIQKCMESFRITKEQKDFLKDFRIY